MLHAIMEHFETHIQRDFHVKITLGIDKMDLNSQVAVLARLTSYTLL